MLKKIIFSLLCGCFFISNSLMAEFITTTDGVRIYYEVAGEGTPLLLIHGGDTNIRRDPESESDFKASASWDTQFQVFSKKYKVIRFDIRGFGQSSLKGTHPINSWEWFENEDRSVTDIVELLKALNIEKTDVIGLSIGSAIAAQLAVYNPKVIDKLILVSPWLEHTFSFALSEQQEYLNNFKDKTLLILGEDDFFSKKEANKAKDNGYDPKRAIIKGGEHFINSDQPEKFNQVVLDFFGRSEDTLLNFSQENKILELYSAYFNRAADAKGFNFWKKSFRIYLSKITTPATDTEKENLALQKITSDMATSTEYHTLYPSSQSSVDFIKTIYINLLGRKSDAGGLAFWSKHIDKGTMSKEQAILNMIAGAKANSTTQGVADGLLIINKTSVSKYFSKTLRSNDLKLAKIAFSNITNHSSSVVTMRATLDLAIRNPTGNKNISNTNININTNNINTSSSNTSSNNNNTSSSNNTNSNTNTNTSNSNTNTNNNTNTTVNNTPEGEIVISGIAKEDEMLTASNTLTDADGLGTITYQWKADGIDIGTTDTYILTSLEIGKTITVTASYTDQKNTDESVISDATMPIEAFINSNTNNTPEGEVIISGTIKEGETLTASNTLTDADGLGVITYQWKADGIDIGTGDTYILTSLEVGKTITVTAIYTDPKNTDESVASNATILVKGTTLHIIETANKETDLGIIIHNQEGSFISYHGPKDENNKLIFVKTMTIFDQSSQESMNIDFNSDYFPEKITFSNGENIYIEKLSDNEMSLSTVDFQNTIIDEIKLPIDKSISDIQKHLKEVPLVSLCEYTVTKEISYIPDSVITGLSKVLDGLAIFASIGNLGVDFAIDKLIKTSLNMSRGIIAGSVADIDKNNIVYTSNAAASITVDCLIPGTADLLSCAVQIARHVGIPLLKAWSKGEIEKGDIRECSKPKKTENYDCQSRIPATFDISKMDRHSVFSICEVNITTKQVEIDFNKYFNNPIQDNICVNGGIYAIFAQKEIDSFDYHEQLFFCAGKRVIANIGFDSEEYFKEAESRYQEYVVVDKTTYDYRIMRNIISNLKSPSRFEALSDSCQGFSSRLESIYNNIITQEHSYIGGMGLTTLYEKPGNRCQSTTPIPSDQGELLGQNSKMHITYKFNENKHKIGTWDITGKAALFLKHLPFPGDVCQNTLSVGKQERNLVQFNSVEKNLQGYLYFDIDKIRFYFPWHTTRVAACLPDISSLLMSGEKLSGADVKFTSNIKYYSSFHMHNIVTKLLKQ